MKRCIRYWKNLSHRKKAIAWFFILWLGSLLTFTIVVYTLRAFFGLIF